MTKEQSEAYDLVVIGSGPGGYVAAIRGAQLGLKVACVERRSTLGGTCLNVGCIPSKALLESSWKYHEARTGLEDHGISMGGVSLDLASMMERKDRIVNTFVKGLEFLFQKNKIARFSGTAKLLPERRVEISGDTREVIQAKNVLIATGSLSAEIPGVKIDGETVLSSTEVLSLTEVPKHLVVIGAGAIGLELGSVWQRLGADVTVVEYLDRVLPDMDKTVAKHCQRFLKKQGMTFYLGARVEGVEQVDDGCRLMLEEKEPLLADKVLLAAGRKPCLDGLGFEELGGKTDDRGFIEVDSSWKTSVEGVYAIGDVVGGAMLAHKASDEGVACVERIVTGYGKINYHAIPSIVYIHPEVACVGRTEEELQKEGTEYTTGVFQFKSNGRALALGENDGMIKVISQKDTDRLLGVHAIGPRAGDVLAEAVAAMSFSASSEDLARIPHAHPTLSEVLREAALDVENSAIHG